MTDLIKVLVDTSDTNGEYIAVDVITAPGGGMPFLHTHPSQETFYILEGEHEIYRQDDDGNKIAIPAGPGSVVHVPNGAPHGYSNVGDTPGKVIMMYDGVGNMDAFFAELGIPVKHLDNPPVPDGPPDMAYILGVCARHNVEFLEAPPA